MSKNKPKCGICNKYVKTIKVENPRGEGEVNFICKEHGVVNYYVEFEIIKESERK